MVRANVRAACRKVRGLSENYDADPMQQALALAADAAQDGDVPVGAVLVIAERRFLARNEKERRMDPTAHAEMLVIRAAAATLGRWRLGEATLYVTKEPCLMCAGAIVAARIARLVFGCRDPKGGAAGSVFNAFESPAANHRVTVVPGVLAEHAAQQLAAFFASRRTRSSQASLPAVEPTTSVGGGPKPRNVL